MSGLYLSFFLTLAYGKGEVEPEVAAEQTRIREEMERLAKQDSWSGVEHHYQQLLEQKRLDVELSANDHMLGASAAASRGDIEELIKRLERSLALENSDTARSWLESLNSRTAMVNIRLEDTESVKIKSEKLLYEQSFSEAVVLAQETLSKSGSFVGRLPVGTYTLSTDIEQHTFSVSLESTERIIIHNKASSVSEAEGVKLFSLKLGTYAQYLYNTEAKFAPRSHASIGGQLGYEIFYSPEKWGVGGSVGVVGAGAFQSTHALFLADIVTGRPVGKRGLLRFGPQVSFGWGRVEGISDAHAKTLCDPQVCSNWDQLKSESISQTLYLNVGSVVSYQHLSSERLRWEIYGSGRFEPNIMVVSGGLTLSLNSKP